VAASVKWLPNELFLVDVTIKPARPNRAMDNITNAINTSIKENPFSLINGLIMKAPCEMVLQWGLQKVYQRIFPPWPRKDDDLKMNNRFNRLETKA
jgi:hypothetical protein